MTPERRAELQRICDEMQRWEDDHLASEQECMSCHDSFHTPSELEPTPLCNLCAQRHVEAVPELLAEVTRLEAAARDVDSMEATLADLKARVADWDDKAASLDGDLGSIERRQLGLLERADRLIAAGAARIDALEVAAKSDRKFIDDQWAEIRPAHARIAELEAETARWKGTVDGLRDDLEAITRDRDVWQRRADRRHLADGHEPKVGQRVVTVREVAEKWGMPHAHIDLVHEITSLLGGDCHLVECGPQQIGVGMLRLAPAGAEVTCRSCAGWREQLHRMRADAEAYRKTEAAIRERDANAARVAELEADLAVREEAHAAFVSAQAEQLVEAEDHTAEQIAAWLVRWTSSGEVATRAAAAGIAGFIRSGKWRLS